MQRKKTRIAYNKGPKTTKQALLRASNKNNKAGNFKSKLDPSSTKEHTRGLKINLVINLLHSGHGLATLEANLFKEVVDWFGAARWSE